MLNPIFPKIVFGTSNLGNLYVELEQQVKNAIVEQCIINSSKPVVFDTAGKYGAGLALQSLGRALNSLGVSPDDVMISNKLGWLRTELKTPEPTFEKGVWKGLRYDAVQKISYGGILECYEQGNQLLGGYKTQFVSVHDPDEYLQAAENQSEREDRYQDILGAYRALSVLKEAGKVKGIGVGSKDWRIIQRIATDVKLDWMMIANSMTVHSHSPELFNFMKKMSDQGVTLINAAVFNGGFLTGGNYYNYKQVDESKQEGRALLEWREKFNAVCKTFAVSPAAVCIRFGLSAPGVNSIALNAAEPMQVLQNFKLAETEIPGTFWVQLYLDALIDRNYLSLLISG